MPAQLSGGLSQPHLPLPRLDLGTEPFFTPRDEDTFVLGVGRTCSVLELELPTKSCERWEVASLCLADGEVVHEGQYLVGAFRHPDP